MKIPDFPNKEQETPYSCGYATLAALGSYFTGLSVGERDIFYDLMTGPERFRVEKMKALLPGLFTKKFKEMLPDYSIETLNPKADQLGDEIGTQLEGGYPVPILWSTEHAKDNGIYIHYSTVIGKENGQVNLANPFGFEETVTGNELVSKMEFKDYTEKPVKVHLAQMLGLVKPRTVFKIIKK